jgi:Mn2+/Fe2+ NRAMP family transporter
MLTTRKRITSILFWSVISAAFIGPGTVTTATQAGVYYNFQLLWALVFSTFATILLQEASARLAIHTKLNLGEALAKQFEGKKSRTLILFTAAIAIILGCAAYEAGNILGAVAGLVMMFEIPYYYFVGGIGILTVLVFALKSVNLIAKVMGVLVFFMGIAFLYTTISLNPNWEEVAIGSLIPRIPNSSGAALLVLGLIGTTVVPYDLFLGSGALDKKQSIQEMRFGLIIAITLGGIISMSIMGVGNAITEGMNDTARANMVYSYTILKDTLEIITGKYAIYIFGFGMFVAGFSSAITSPLASAITAGSLFSNKKNQQKWKPGSIYFNLVIIGVLGTGLTFGFMDVKPIPAIILAQAFNGLILPLIAIFLIYVINDTNIMGRANLNGWFSNFLMGFVLWITFILGFTNIIQSISTALHYDIKTNDGAILIPMVTVSFILTFIVLYKIYKRRLTHQEI